jgi:hypothetical protein
VRSTAFSSRDSVGWLARPPPVCGQLPADQFEQWTGAQEIGIVLVLIAARDLEDALAHQGFPRVAHRPAAPLGNQGGEGRGQPQGDIRLCQPRQAAITAQATAIKTGFQRQRRGAGKAKDGCGRLGHAGTS